MAKIERSRSDSQLEQVISAESSLPLEGIVSGAEGIITRRLEDTVTEDGILSVILSSLTLVESVRTSVLSPRWRHLWPRRTKFIFDAVSVLDCHGLRDTPLGGPEAYEITKGMTPRFIQSVNSILPQIQGSTIHEFSVRFFLDKTHSQHLDSWFSFALASKARTLKFHLFKPCTKAWIEPYDFPCHLLSYSSSSYFIKLLSLRNCTFKLPCKFDGLSNLKILSMVDVDINEEDFNRIVSNCSLTLAKICLWGAPQLVSISIPQPLNQLHTLVVGNCYQLRKIETSTVNLVKFQYDGAPVDIKFRQSSKPNDACIHFRNEGTVCNLDFCLNKISRSCLRFRRLNLKITGASQVADLPKGSSRFIHLTHLEWEWNDHVSMSLLHLATLLNVAPLLEEMKLSFLERVLEPPPQTPFKFKGMLPEHRHTYLKKSQVCGFYFDTWQIEIAVYLFNHAVKLESMMIKRDSNPSWLVSNEIQERGTKILRQEAPAKVELLIL